MEDETITIAETQEEATGVKAEESIASFFVYYDPHGHQFVFVNEPLQVQIVNEDNYLNSAIEAMLDANAKLTTARDACLEAIDKAQSPEKLSPSVYQQLMDRFDAEQKNANEKRQTMDAIHKSLDALDEKVAKPLNEMKVIRELIPVAGSTSLNYASKVRYVRPSVAFATNQLQATGSGSIEWKAIPIPPEKETNFLKNNEFNRDIFKQVFIDTIKKPEVQSDLKASFSSVLPETLRMRTGFLTTFAENWSKAAQYDRAASCKALVQKGLMTQQECDSQIFDFSAAAQFLRYTHGIGIEGTFNPLSFKASLKAEGKAELALLEAKSTFGWNIPDRRGWMLSLPAKNGSNADLGLIRLVFEIILSGFVGASIAGEVSINVNAKGLIRGENGKNENPAPDPMGNRFDFDRFAQDPSKNATAAASASAGAFAGAEGTAKFFMAIQWKNPEERKEEDKYKSFAQYMIGASIQAGIGGQAKFSIGYQEKVGFYIEAQAGLCFGYGAKGLMKLTIDAVCIGEFLVWFAYQFRNVDFQKIRDLISDTNYERLGMLQYLLIASTYTAEAVQGMMMVIDNVVDAYRAHNDLVKLMERLEADPELFKHALPEVKGNILYRLTDTNFITHNLSFSVQNNDVFSGESWLLGSMKRLKRVVLNLIKYIQSKSEYRNVMQFMSFNMGVKSDWKMNEQKLLEFFDTGELNSWLVQWAFTNYDGTFQEWLHDLPEEDRQKEQSAMSFYDQLPDGPLRGVPIDVTVLANQRYFSGAMGTYVQPTYDAPEFRNCRAPYRCDAEYLQMLEDRPPNTDFGGGGCIVAGVCAPTSTPTSGTVNPSIGN